MTEADPARTPRDAAPDAGALATRDRILRKARLAHRPHSRAVGWASGAVAAGAAAIFTVAMLLPQDTATAGSPTPLTFVGASTVAEIVDAAEEDLLAVEGPAVPLRAVHAASWGFSVDVVDQNTQVVPQLSELTWNPDGSGRMTIIRGVPYDPADAVANNSAEVSRSDDVLSDVIMAPGDFEPPWPEIPGDSREDVLALLTAFGMPAQPTAFDIETAFTSTFDMWTLTNAQHREILSLLEETGEGMALGDSTDRLGRPVAGLQFLTPDKGAKDVVLVSLETGRIVGVERTAIKADDVFPVGAIISYRMWDVESEVTR
ncbi:hypothetical protein [Microbacterium croceum]|uniref:hypothetical protein n=1 Tax=Microbacterium croceum TaxID=2851645 RepID=UPI001FFDCF86|nr:hypothetical protein [Microbacterium croceum]